MSWHVYILRCSNGSYYTGHTQNVSARFIAHQTGRGSSHTAKYRPVELLYTETVADKTTAAKRERQIKKWSRAKKEALIRDNLVELKLLARCRSLYPEQSKEGEDLVK